MSVDRKFEVVRPTLDRLNRAPLDINNVALLNPNSVSPLALVDGELVAMVAGGKLDRASDGTVPSFFSIDDRGDATVQATRKLTVIMGGGSFLCNTVIFDSSLGTRGAKLQQGTVTVESLSRSGLIAQSGSGLILGYVMKLPSENSGKLQVFVSFN